MNLSAVDIALLAGLAFLVHRVLRRRSTPLPPGPGGLPLVGNLLDFPTTQPWKVFSQLGQKYGGIIHFRILSQSVIVLHDAKYAVELLEKKSRIYSDRPKLVMAGELIGWDASPAFLSFGKAFKEQRRVLAQFMGTQEKVNRFHDIIRGKIHAFLHDISMDPTGWVNHCSKLTGATMLALICGYEAKESDDPLIELATKAMDQFSELTAPNAFLVDTFPILRFIPSWFPGASWKRKIPEYRSSLRDVLDVPYNWTRQQMACGAALPCLVADLTSDGQVSAEDEFKIKWSTMAVFGGGVDTTSGIIESFVLMMTMYPDVQRKAQQEIDSVTRFERFLTSEDREHLPYSEAVLLEVLRLYNVVPLGLPHVTAEDDIHDGYFIPKGSIILPNAWQYARDEKTYRDPDTFNPERFLATDGHPKEKDPRDYVFGFGRRICPGRHLANTMMWLACASLISVFDISAPIKDGKPVLPSGKCKDGTISHPEPFECVIKPRSAAADLVLRLSEKAKHRDERQL